MKTEFFQDGSQTLWQMMLIFYRDQAITPIHLVLKIGWDLLIQDRDSMFTNILKKTDAAKNNTFRKILGQ